MRNMKKKSLFFGLGLVAFQMISLAQEIERRDPGAWAMLLLKYKTQTPWKFSLESHERTWGFFNDQALTILRPAVHRDLTNHIEAAVGASWLTSPPSGQELNAWEQLTIGGAARDWAWSTRIREEQRWLRQEISEEEPGPDHKLQWAQANRLRVRFTVKHPLPFAPERWYFEGFVEWWLSQDSAFRTVGMERTWHTLSVGRHLSDQMSLQLMALQQRDATPSGWNAHLIGQLTLIYSGGGG